MSDFSALKREVLLPCQINGLKPPQTSLSVRKCFATVSTRIIALPAYRGFQLDYNRSGFTQGSQITL